MTTPDAPRYLQLADELRRAIRRGELAPGQRVPSETELGEQYGVSRVTVRLAMGVLRNEALVVTQHGRGTFVREGPPVRLQSSRYSNGRQEPGVGPFTAATRLAGIAGDVELLSVEQMKADGALADRLEVDEGAGVILRRRHLLVDGAVVQIYDGYYPEDLVAGTALAGATRVGGVANAWQQIGVTPTRATEEVTARAATPEEAATMRLRPGIPVLTIVRTTRDTDSRVIEVLYVVASAEANVFVYEDLPLQ